MVITPTMAIGEGYMQGHLTVEDGTIYDFLSLLGQNIETHGQHPFRLMVEMVSRLFKRFQQFNLQLLSKKMWRTIMTFHKNYTSCFWAQTYNILVHISILRRRI